MDISVFSHFTRIVNLDFWLIIASLEMNSSVFRNKTKQN